MGKRAKRSTIHHTVIIEVDGRYDDEYIAAFERGLERLCFELKGNGARLERIFRHTDTDTDLHDYAEWSSQWH